MCCICACFFLAINICFLEKSVYTQEVLAVVLQQLLEQSSVPVLFMRTVSVELYSRYICTYYICIIQSSNSPSDKAICVPLYNLPAHPSIECWTS